jgi:RecJ-like exonuclease
MSRVAIYGAIGDYADDSEFMQLIISYWDKRMLYFESGLLSQGLDYIRRDYRSKRRILESLAMNLLPSSDAELAGAAIEESRLEERMRKEVTVKVRTLGKIAYVLNIEGSIGKAAIYARAVTGLQIGIAGEEERGYVDMSLRSVREGLDLDRILRRLAPSFGGTGGGHPKAAGASIPVESFQLFVKALDELT